MINPWMEWGIIFPDKPIEPSVCSVATAHCIPSRPKVVWYGRLVGHCLARSGNLICNIYIYMYIIYIYIHTYICYRQYDINPKLYIHTLLRSRRCTVSKISWAPNKSFSTGNGMPCQWGFPIYTVGCQLVWLGNCRDSFLYVGLSLFSSCW